MINRSVQAIELADFLQIQESVAVIINLCVDSLLYLYVLSH